MLERVEHPTVQKSDFDPRRRAPGIAAIVRAKNEAQFLEQAVTSILPFADDVVITFNDCTDATPDVVAELARRHPGQIRAYEYVPRVFPPGSDEQRTLPSDHINSFLFYTNFALSRARRRVCFLWDSDQIAIPQAFRKIVRQLRTLKPYAAEWWLSPLKWGYWYYQGVNLWARDGELYVLKTRPLIGTQRDHGFYTLTPRVRYRHHPRYPILNTRWLWRKRIGVLFYHLKYLKPDHGHGMYQLERYPRSYYHESYARIETNPEIWTPEQVAAFEPSLRGLPAPEALGIRAPEV
jgi:cellulose synthase/poly-beta-1,6-N-acetylglucosamine synthase-like glycosyltransferase